MLKSTSDEDLLRRISQNDEGALQELLRRYYTKLGAFAYSLLRRRDLAEEAVSNVFLSLWRRRESLTIRSKVRTYLYAAVGNQSFSLRRSELPPGIICFDEALVGELADESQADTALLYQELQQEINQLIEQMPPQRQAIFRLNRIDGLRYAEIAESLGLAESTVQNHMVHAMKHLALELPKLRATLARQGTLISGRSRVPHRAEA